MSDTEAAPAFIRQKYYRVYWCGEATVEAILQELDADNWTRGLWVDSLARATPFSEDAVVAVRLAGEWMLRALCRIVGPDGGPNDLVASYLRSSERR